MNKRDKLIVKYASDLKEKYSIIPDMDLLKKIAIGCGPCIYNADSSILTVIKPFQLKTIRNMFLIRRLGLDFNDNLYETIETVVAQYGGANVSKYRVVIYYLLVKHFEKESVY